MAGSIAEQRIERLFELADRRIEEDRKDSQELADRYVELARKIGMTYNVSIQGDLKKRFCQRCFSFLKPGFNCKVRINSRNNTLNYRCERCGEVNRYGL